MGRKSHSQSLSIWTNGLRVGLWSLPARGEMQLQYDADWVRSAVGRPSLRPRLSLRAKRGNPCPHGLPRRSAPRSDEKNVTPRSDEEKTLLAVTKKAVI